MTEAEQIMKRCQTGTFSYEESNNLHAACYGMIGKLLAQRKPLTDERIDLINGGMCGEREFYQEFARAIEAAHDIRENT